MEITIRDYRDEDEQEWMRTHAIVLSISHAWNYSIQERPKYERDSIKLVAIAEEKLVGLLDAEIERKPGEICMLKNSIGCYILEFGRLPEYAGHRIGTKLIEVAKEQLIAKGVHRMEFWSQDEKAQGFYKKWGMKEINRHMRFRIKPNKEIEDLLRRDLIGCEYIYGACLLEVYPDVKKRYEVIEHHPLEPHVCVGYEIRF